MFSRNTFVVVSAIALAVAATCGQAGPAHAGEAPAQKEGNNLYTPIENISYTFGSKAVSGYFVQQNSVCVVTLMVIEKTDPDLPQPTAARVRIMLDPFQVAGLDSEEGRSLNLTCGEGAGTLAVDYGERDQLVARQGLAVTKTISERVAR
jgi:hypothetical protein